MGCSLGPLMEIERVVAKDLFNKGDFKFDARYMDYKLVLMKKIRPSHCFASNKLYL